MNITEIRIRFPERGSPSKLKAFVTVVVDGCLVIHEIKIIESGAGDLFLAMPSRKLADCCPVRGCPGKNHLKDRYCSTCGSELPLREIERDARGRERLHVDVVHPIDEATRRRFEAAVFDAYRAELEPDRPAASSLS